jgi:hypothetical protein
MNLRVNCGESCEVKAVLIPTSRTKSTFVAASFEPSTGPMTNVIGGAVPLRRALANIPAISAHQTQAMLT